MNTRPSDASGERGHFATSPLRHFATPAWLLLALLAVLSGCQSAPKVDSSPLEQAGMYFNNIAQLREFHLTQDEVSQLAQARQAGLTDEDCVALINLSRRHDRPFNEGATIAGLLRAGFQEPSVMALVRLDQMNFAGEAQVMKLAGLSDDVILAVARRRNAGQPVLSSAKAAALRNVQMTNAQILRAVNRGTTDAQADAIIAQRSRAAKGFVRQRGTRR
jgi:hypothetical protein